MFSLGFLEILVLLSIALIVLGPEQLPKAARTAARFIHQLRAVKDDVYRRFSDSDSK